MARHETSREEESEPSGAQAETKEAASSEKPWMVWKGKPGQHTPPLPSHDLGEGYVKVYISSMEEAEQYAATGLWELQIPDGALRKKRPELPQEG